MKKDKKDVERGHRAVLALSRFSNLTRFRFFLFKTHFGPFPNLSLPFSFPIPSLSCTVYLSYPDTRPFGHNHWTTLDHHWSAGPVGGLYLRQRDARDQFEQYVCSCVWEQSKQQRHESEGVGCVAITTYFVA